MEADDYRLAKAARLLRRRKRLRQRDLVAPGRSLHFVRAVESGRAGSLDIALVREHFRALDASVRVTVWWNGAALDRLVDRRHAVVVEGLVAALRPYAFETRTEVTFSEFGERGSVDVRGASRDLSALVIGEAKSEWGSIEETLRALDVKSRLAAIVCLKTFGFTPTHVATLLVFPEDSTARRIAANMAGTLDSAFPSRGHEIRNWLRQPSGSLRGIWFLSNVRPDAAPRRP